MDGVADTPEKMEKYILSLIHIQMCIRDRYGTERTDRMDYDYMKSTYPDTAKRVLPLVEEECDRLEYSSSMIYDERCV